MNAKLESGTKQSKEEMMIRDPEPLCHICMTLALYNLDSIDGDYISV